MIWSTVWPFGFAASRLAIAMPFWQLWYLRHVETTVVMAGQMASALVPLLGTGTDF